MLIQIIAILAAMLLPALSRAREMARMSHCMNSLKTVGSAFSFYLDDNTDTMPHYGAANGLIAEMARLPESEQSRAWPWAISPYFGSPFPYNDGRRWLPVSCSSRRGARYGMGTQIHYGYNFHHVGSNNRYGGGLGASPKLSMFKRPSHTILTIETTRWADAEKLRNGTGHYMCNDNLNPSPSPTNDYGPVGIHNNVATMNAVDGHVEKVLSSRFDISRIFDGIGRYLGTANPTASYKSRWMR